MIFLGQQIPPTAFLFGVLENSTTASQNVAPTCSYKVTTRGLRWFSKSTHAQPYFGACQPETKTTQLLKEHILDFTEAALLAQQLPTKGSLCFLKFE